MWHVVTPFVEFINCVFFCTQCNGKFNVENVWIVDIGTKYTHFVCVAVFIHYTVAMWERLAGGSNVFICSLFEIEYFVCTYLSLLHQHHFDAITTSLVVKLTKLTLALCVDTFAPISKSTRVIFRWPTSFYYSTRTCLCLVKQQFCVCLCFVLVDAC